MCSIIDVSNVDDSNGPVTPEQICPICSLRIQGLFRTDGGNIAKKSVPDFKRKTSSNRKSLPRTTVELLPYVFCNGLQELKTELGDISEAAFTTAYNLYCREMKRQHTGTISVKEFTKKVSQTDLIHNCNLQCQAENMQIFFAVAGDQVVSFLTATVERTPGTFFSHTQCIGYIAELWTHTTKRGEGLALALLDRARSWLADKQATLIYLFVSQSHYDAIKWYTKRGYIAYTPATTRPPGTVNVLFDIMGMYTDRIKPIQSIIRLPSNQPDVKAPSWRIQQDWFDQKLVERGDIVMYHVPSRA